MAAVDDYNYYNLAICVRYDGHGLIFHISAGGCQRVKKNEWPSSIKYVYEIHEQLLDAFKHIKNRSKQYPRWVKSKNGQVCVIS
jgi:hypothetical protein